MCNFAFVLDYENIKSLTKFPSHFANKVTTVKLYCYEDVKPVWYINVIIIIIQCT